jgi:hypothetical protein
VRYTGVDVSQGKSAPKLGGSDLPDRDPAPILSLPFAKAQVNFADFAQVGATPLAAAVGVVESCSDQDHRINFQLMAAGSSSVRDWETTPESVEAASVARITWKSVAVGTKMILSTERVQ